MELNIALYIAGLLICLCLPDLRQKAPAHPEPIAQIGFLNRETWFVLLSYGSLLGGASVCSWLLQLRGSHYFGNEHGLFAMIQIGGAAASLVGVLLSRRFEQSWVPIGVMSSLLLVGSGLLNSSGGLWLAIALGLLARGGLAVVAREKLWSHATSDAPIATLSFALNGWAKLAQALILLVATNLLPHA
jgi:hypothetical protein